MPVFEQGDIIRVPFPYTDRDTRQRRPALVVSVGALGENEALVWAVMITSAENRPWPGDVAIDDHSTAGLPAPSVVRPAKIATVETGQIDRIGRLPDTALSAVMSTIRAQISG